MKRCIARILLVVLLFDSIMGYLPYTVKAAQTDESYGEVTISGCDADSNLLYEQTADGIKITGVSDNTISELVFGTLVIKAMPPKRFSRKKCHQAR